MEFSRQEYWNGLPFPPPGDLPRDRTLVSCPPALAGGSLPLGPPGVILGAEIGGMGGTKSSPLPLFLSFNPVYLQESVSVWG